MPTIELPQGAVRYRVAGEQASGPPVVFVHGFLVNATLWVKTADALAAAGVRSYAPDWPLGAHARTGGWRRPIPARSRPSGTQLHRGARARRRDAGGQRHRRRDLPVPAGHRRVAHRPTRTDQLRRLRQLPSTTFRSPVQGLSKHRRDPRPDGPDARGRRPSLARGLRTARERAPRRAADAGLGRAVPDRRGRPRGRRSLRSSGGPSGSPRRVQPPGPLRSAPLCWSGEPRTGSSSSTSGDGCAMSSPTRV